MTAPLEQTLLWFICRKLVELILVFYKPYRLPYDLPLTSRALQQLGEPLRLSLRALEGLAVPQRRREVINAVQVALYVLWRDASDRDLDHGEASGNLREACEAIAEFASCFFDEVFLLWAGGASATLQAHFEDLVRMCESVYQEIVRERGLDPQGRGI